MTFRAPPERAGDLRAAGFQVRTPIAKGCASTDSARIETSIVRRTRETSHLGRVPVEREVQLLARRGLVVVVDQRDFVVRREDVDPERVDSELLAHRDHPAALLDVVEAGDLGLVAQSDHLRLA